MTTISTIIGNVVSEIEPRISQAGKPWCQVRVASTPRERDRQTGDFKDGETMFVTVKLFGDYADNAAQSISKGTRITATGKLKYRSYKDNQGADRQVIELDEIEAFGPDLRWATAQVSRKSGGGGAQQAQGGAGQSGWATTPPGSSGGATSDPGGFGNFGPEESQPF
ncbi:single-stranded DNA-binding protein [Leucobacter sp. NPDC015123]|uniref:single-stranded DNA-binding protein n=1 Tax=Leucobacter sp. NPDC015123 TaxID=3364129 RepID=UPI0036F4AF3B